MTSAIKLNNGVGGSTSLVGSNVNTHITQTLPAASGILLLQSQIKTINGASLVGSGDLVVDGGTISAGATLVTPQMFGVLNDGSDETVAMQAWASDVRPNKYLPSGVYKTNKIIFDPHLKLLTGEGASSIIQGVGTIDDTGGACLFNFNGCSNLTIREFAMDLSLITNPTVGYALQLFACETVTVSDVAIINAGRFAVFATISSWINIMNMKIDTFSQGMINFDTCGNSRITNVSSPHVSTAAGGFGIQLTQCDGVQVSGCYVAGAGVGAGASFGIALSGSDNCIISNNTVHAQKLEAIQITNGTNNQVLNNQMHCAVGHVDFGFSVYSETETAQYNTISGNTINGSGGPGIGISASFDITVEGHHYTYQVCQFNTISNNMIINPCSDSTVYVPPKVYVRCGIQLLGGAGCVNNTIENNTIYDILGLVIYGVAEESSYYVNVPNGTSEGVPTSNLLSNNVYVGANTKGAHLVLGSTTKAVDPLLVNGMDLLFPEQFGAKGDGVADDTAAWTTMFTRAVSLGGAYIVAAGHYNLPIGITLTGATNVTIDGKNSGKISSAAVSVNAFYAASCTNLTIKDLKVFVPRTNTRATGGMAIIIGESSDVTVSGCNTDGALSGIWTVNCNDVLVTGCTVDTPKADGIHFGHGSDRCKALGNTVKDPGDDGFSTTYYTGYDRPNEISFIGNTVIGGYWGFGIAVYSADNVVISDNILTDTALGGIQVTAYSGGADSTNVVVSGNTINGSNRVGYIPNIYWGYVGPDTAIGGNLHISSCVIQGSDILFTGNKISAVTSTASGVTAQDVRNGLTFNGGSRLTVSNNLFSNVNGVGIDLGTIALSQIAISNNDFEQVAYTAIRGSVAIGTSATITGNTQGYGANLGDATMMNITGTGSVSMIVANNTSAGQRGSTFDLTNNPQLQLVNNNFGLADPKLRVLLTADLSVYVATTGNDTTGTGGISLPFLTLQRAWHYIQDNVDRNGFNVYMLVGAGTFAGFDTAPNTAPYINQPLVPVTVVGAGYLNTTLTAGTVSTGACIFARFGAQLTISECTITSTGGQGGLVSTSGAMMLIGTGISFGACPSGAHMRVKDAGRMQIKGAYRIDGNAAIHMAANGGGSSITEGGAYTITVAAGLSIPEFVQCGQTAYIGLSLTTFSSNAVTGKKWSVYGNAFLNYGYWAGKLAGFPGSLPGVETDGGMTDGYCKLGYGLLQGCERTQLTNRTTTVDVSNYLTGVITLFTAAGSSFPESFTVTASSVGADDIIMLSVKSSTNTYVATVSAVAAGSFRITFWAASGTASDAPKISWAIFRGAIA